MQKGLALGHNTFEAGAKQILKRFSQQFDYNNAFPWFVKLALECGQKF